MWKLPCALFICSVIATGPLGGDDQCKLKSEIMDLCCGYEESMYRMLEVTRNILKAGDHRANLYEEHLFELRSELDHHQRVARENERRLRPVTERGNVHTITIHTGYDEAVTQSWRRYHDAIDQATNEWDIAVDEAIKSVKRISSEKTHTSFDLARRIVAGAQDRLSMLTLAINQTNSPQ